MHRRLSIVALALMVATPFARADRAPIPTHVARARTPRAVAAPHPAAARAGMVVGLDPETGMIGPPTPEQRSRLGVAVSAAGPARPAPVYHAGGRISLDVRSWMREYSVVRLGADGTPARACVSGRDAAMDALHAPPAPATEDR